MLRTIRFIVTSATALALVVPAAAQARPAAEPTLPASESTQVTTLPGSHVGSPVVDPRIEGPAQFQAGAWDPSEVSPLEPATDDGSGPAPWILAGASLALFAAVGGMSLVARRKLLPHRATGAQV